MKLKQYNIISNIEISPNAYLLSVHRDFDFEPGQVVHISINNILEPRIYSICSNNIDTTICILYSVRNEGMLTPQLCELKTGDSIYMSVPTGAFHATPNKACFIATGTGISPFYSMLQSGNYKNKTVIHGARTESGFYFAKELNQLLKTNYIRCSSSNSIENCFLGRVTDYINQTNTLSFDQMFYLCGSAEMVVETRDILISKGVAFRNIVAEIYF